MIQNRKEYNKQQFYKSKNIYKKLFMKKIRRQATHLLRDQ